MYLPLPRVFMSRMPGRGKSGPHRVRHLKAKQQKKRFIRSKDPLLSVFMWGVQHSVSCRHVCLMSNWTTISMRRDGTRGDLIILYSWLSAVVLIHKESGDGLLVETISVSPCQFEGIGMIDGFKGYVLLFLVVIKRGNLHKFVTANMGIPYRNSLIL